MSKKYILETDYEIPFDKNIRYITIDLQECDKNNLYPLNESAIEQRGAEKAWALARWVNNEADGDDLEEVFPYEWDKDSYTAIMSLSYDEAREKYELWQKKKAAEIKVGDEIVSINNTAVYYVIKTFNDYVNAIDSNGYFYTLTHLENFRKTGKHFPEVAELMKKIGGGNDCTESIYIPMEK